MPETTPDQLAKLDPYGLRKRKPNSIESARIALNFPAINRETTSVKDSEKEEFRDDLIKTEEKAWERILGGVVKVEEKLPSFVDQNFIDKLDKQKMVLRYIPKFDFKDPENEIYIKYPQWSQLKSLPNKLLTNWDNPRIFKEDDLKDIGSYKIKKAQVGLGWIAIENGSIDNSTGKYNDRDFPLNLLLGLSDREYTYPETEQKLINSRKNILNYFGLYNPQAMVRLPTIVEYNLLMTRDKFSTMSPNYAEWTLSYKDGFMGRKQGTMGLQTVFGPADIRFVNPESIYGISGFRVAMELQDDPGPVLGIDL